MAEIIENSRLISRNGYTLIELVVVMVIMAILAGVAIQSLGGALETARFEETRTEMDQLAKGIAGDPSLKTGGARTDYGYIGDIGALPSDWDDLVTDPGYSTWHGPYVQDEFASGTANTEFKIDAWGTEYSSPNGYQFSSTGGSETMTRKLANSIDDLLYNSVSMAVVDLDFTPPGTDYIDSVELILTYPNGTGSYRSVSRHPDADGFVSFDSIPIGIHTMKMVYLPSDDTLIQKVNIDPGGDYYADLQYYADVWSAVQDTTDSTELEYIEGSDTLTSGNCFKMAFWIENNTGAPLTITSMQVNWTGPTAYFKNIYWGNVLVRTGSPALTDGSLATISPPQTINDGESVQIRFEQFHQNPGSVGNPVNMTGTEFNIKISDGSIITFTADNCGG